MKNLSIRITEKQLEFLNKNKWKNKGEAIREIINFFIEVQMNGNKKIMELENNNKQLTIIIQSMKLALDEREKRLDEKEEKYVQVIHEKDEKYNILEVVQKEQANIYKTVLKQKDDLLTEIKNMNMWKRIFLKLA